MAAPRSRRFVLGGLAAAGVAAGVAAATRRVRGAVVGARAFADSRVEGASFPRRLVDPAGEVRVLAAPPRRIVSTYLACDETLPALVDASRVVAISVYADDPSASNCLGFYPPAVTRLRSDPEQILALEPDLVCVSGFNELESVRLLAGAGVPLLRQSRLDSFAELTAGLRLFGAALGEDARAEAVAGEVEAQLADLARRLAGVRPVRVLYYDPPGFTMGERTMVDEILTRAGGRNVARELGIRGPGQIGLEALLSLQPEAIFVPRYGDNASALGALSASEAWRRLPAVVAGRVHEIRGAAINTVSHHAASGLVQVARLLHPQAFAG
jgi:iron complex transport system substrate-binding protein